MHSDSSQTPAAVELQGGHRPEVEALTLCTSGKVLTLDLKHLALLY